MSVRSRVARQVVVIASVLATATTLPPGIARSAAPQHPSLPDTVSRAQPVRLAASAQPVQDATGHTWQPDRGYATGGRLTTTLQPIAHTASPLLYQDARRGVTGYRVPVATPGQYFV